MSNLKLCSVCGVHKTRDEYHKDPSSKDGLHHRCKECKAHYGRKRKYDCSREEYEWLHTMQEGKCAICQEQDKPLVVDHCHESGTVRGLLCHHCNIALGMFKDNVGLLQEALIYLIETRK